MNLNEFLKYIKYIKILFKNENYYMILEGKNKVIK